MRKMSMQEVAAVLLIAGLAGCGGSADAPAVTEAPSSRNAAAKAAAIEAEAAEVNAITPEMRAALIAMIQAGGGACADVVRVRSEDLSNKVEVTCVEHAGGSGEVQYTVDLESEGVERRG